MEKISENNKEFSYSNNIKGVNLSDAATRLRIRKCTKNGDFENELMIEVDNLKYFKLNPDIIFPGRIFGKSEKELSNSDITFLNTPVPAEELDLPTFNIFYTHKSDLKIKVKTKNPWNGYYTRMDPSYQGEATLAGLVTPIVEIENDDDNEKKRLMNYWDSDSGSRFAEAFSDEGYEKRREKYIEMLNENKVEV